MAEGFFTNENDFFGPDRKEYLHVTQETGCWQGMKVVGDENVPRGKVCFRTCEGEDVENGHMKAQLQVRNDTSDPNGFSWMDGFSVAYDTHSDSWLLLDGDQHFGTLGRSTEEEAMQAAETSTDYSKSDWAERLASRGTDFVQMFGETLVSKDGEVPTADVFKTGKSCVMIYFSAHWCPPCRGFTPGLAEAYKGSEKAGQDTVIIFASSDRDQEGFDEYYAEMPWHAIPFSNSGAKQKLSEQFGISGIPTLVVLDGAGQLITKEGRAEYAKYL